MRELDGDGDQKKQNKTPRSFLQCVQKVYSLTHGFLSESSSTIRLPVQGDSRTGNRNRKEHGGCGEEEKE